MKNGLLGKSAELTGCPGWLVWFSGHSAGASGGAFTMALTVRIFHATCKPGLGATLGSSLAIRQHVFLGSASAQYCELRFGPIFTLGFLHLSLPRQRKFHDMLIGDISPGHKYWWRQRLLPRSRGFARIADGKANKFSIRLAASRGSVKER